MEEAYPGTTFNDEAMYARGSTFKSEIFVALEAKKIDGALQTLFTREAYQEMIELEEYIMNIAPMQEMMDELTVDEQLTFYKLCEKVNITNEGREA